MAGNSDHAVDFSAGMLMEPTQLADWLIIQVAIVGALEPKAESFGVSCFGQ